MLTERTDWGVQLHRGAWPLTAHYWLDMCGAPRVLHFLLQCLSLHHNYYFTEKVANFTAAVTSLHNCVHILLLHNEIKFCNKLE